jgi:hypothetical protein
MTVLLTWTCATSALLAGCGVSGGIVATPKGGWFNSPEVSYRSYFDGPSRALQVEERFSVGSRAQVYVSGGVVFLDVNSPRPDMPPAYASQYASAMTVASVGAGVLRTVKAGESTSIALGIGLRLALWPETISGAKVGPATWRFRSTTSTTKVLSTPLSFEIAVDTGVKGKLVTTVEYDFAHNAPGWSISTTSSDPSDPFSALSVRVGYYW